MNGKKIALRLLCLLLMVVNSACHSTQPEGQGKGDAAYQQAMSKARERCENSSFALAELEARKALQLRPSDSEATLLLFTCLKEQSDPKLQEEALKLAQGLSQELEEESDDMLAVQAFIDRVANEDLLAELREAAKEKKPETAELLEKVPSNLRDEAYWRLAFEYQKSAGKKEKAAEAAANWMDYNPTGLLAKEAQFMASRYKSGLFEGPAAAFESYLKASKGERGIYLLQSHESFDVLDVVLEKAEVKKVEAREKFLVVTVDYVDPYTKKQETADLRLVYEQRDGVALLNKDRFHFGPAIKLLGDAAHPLSDDLRNISPLERKRYSAFLRSDLKAVFGQSRALDRNRFGMEGETRRMVKEMGGGPDNPAFDTDNLYFFSNGDVAFEPVSGAEEYLELSCISGPSIRTKAGLGVGNTLADFSSGGYEVIAGPGPRREHGFYTLPYTLNGPIRRFSAAVVKHNTDTTIYGTMLCLDQNERVVGILPGKGSHSYDFYK